MEESGSPEGRVEPGSHLFVKWARRLELASWRLEVTTARVQCFQGNGTGCLYQRFFQEGGTKWPIGHLGAPESGGWNAGEGVSQGP